MWIDGYRRRYEWDYYDREVTFYNMAKGCDVTRTQKVWSSKLFWVPCKIHVGKHKYQKKAHHAKKVKTEKDIARDDWREFKQFKRDKGQADYRNGCKTFCKRLGWRSHRRFSNQALKAENYDKMHRKDYKHFVDPWDWD